jgi:citrate synthase
MLQEIGDETKVDGWVETALATKKKVMGIGHRVYKTLDPRAPHLRSMAVQLCEQLGEGKWIRMQLAQPEHELLGSVRVPLAPNAR